MELVLSRLCISPDGQLWIISSGDDLESLCLGHVICQSQRSVCLLFLCSGSVLVVNWIRLSWDLL